MKYIMLVTDTGRSLPVLFTDSLIHESMAQAVMCRLWHDTGERCEPVSAGFVEWRNNVPSVFGRSESLFLDSRPVDTVRIALGPCVEFLPDDMVMQNYAALAR